MKKIIYIVTLLSLFISTVNANYKIENYKIDITVLQDGSLEIQEAFNMEKPYNGYERIIYYKNNYNGYLGSIISSVEDSKIYDGSDLKLNEIRAINFDINDNFSNIKENGDLFKKVTNANKGDYGVYTITKLDNGEKYKIYNSSIMNKDIYIDYTLKDIAITHVDISEISINISEFQENIKNLDIYVHIPNNTNLLKAFVHNIKNEIEILDINTLKISIKNVFSNKSFDFRIIADKNNNYKKKTNEIVYDNILKIEKELNSNLNNKDEEYEKLKSLSYDSILKVEKSLKREDYDYALKMVSNLNDDDELKTELIVRLMNVESKVLRKEMFIKLFYTSILFISFLSLFILCYYIYKKYDKGYKVTFKSKKIEYIPSNISCSSLGYLFRRKINDNDLKASILNLIYNGKIKFSKINEEDFILKKVLSHNLSESDSKLIKLIFQDKNTVKFSKLKERVSKNYNDFITNYSNWITRSTIEAESLEFYEDILFPKITGIVLSIIGFVISVMFINYDTYFPSYILLISSILFFIYFLLLSKKTAKGYEEIAKWKAFKSYLNNYNKSINDNDINEINKYLTYSIVLNNHEKVSKSILLRYAGEHKKEKEIKKSIYLNNSIIKAIDRLLTKAYSTKNIEFFE